MVKNLGFIFGGLALAVATAFGEIDDSRTNTVAVVETKLPEIASFNFIYSNNVQYVELKGKINSANFKKYVIQSTTNLSSNSWQDVCPLENCVDSKKEGFYFLDLVDSQGSFYRIKYNK